MWKKFKWDMFVTSFIPLWLSIIVIDVWDIVLFIIENWDSRRIVDNLMSVLRINFIQLASIVVIAILVLISIIGINSFLSEKLIKNKNHLPSGTIEWATKANKLSSEFLLAYILSMIAFNFGNPKHLALFIIYFSVLACLCIRNNNIYTNILLEFKGYRIYTCDFTVKCPGHNYTYYDSIVISRIDLTQEQGNDILYWDFDKYIYITADEEDK